MKEIVSILLIGISLSMDTFSLCLGIGAINSDRKLLKYIPLAVGLFHFFMPLLGNILGIKLINLFSITTDKLLGIILIAIGINLFIHYFKDENYEFNLSFLGIMLLSLTVSIDSFSVGIGISAITNKYLSASIIFAICSASFTFMGLLIGKYSSKFLGKYANFLGIILLLILGIIHLFN